MDEDNRQFGKKNSYAIQPESYGKFLCELFDLWYEDFKAGYIMDVRMFSNLAQMAVGYPPEECGMCGQCKCYFVVEGDGSVYSCDFYCMDGYRLGTVGERIETFKADVSMLVQYKRKVGYLGIMNGSRRNIWIRKCVKICY